MSPKLIAFIVSLFLGMYFLSTGSIVFGLVFICVAVLIPAA